MPALRLNASFLEKPFLVRQVETHILLGPISRYFPLALLVLIVFVVRFARKFYQSGTPTDQLLANLPAVLPLVVILLVLMLMTRLQQAIVAWFCLKLILSIVALYLIFSSFFAMEHGAGWVWPNVILGLLWLPGPEFIPAVVPHQRYLSIARVLLSILCFYLGVETMSPTWR